MKWLLLIVALLLIAGVLAMIFNVAGAARFFLRRRRPTWDSARPQLRCLPCGGTGWINREPERTLNFTGDGFEDRHEPAIVCPSCAGTGVATKR